MQLITALLFFATGPVEYSTGFQQSVAFRSHRSNKKKSSLCSSYLDSLVGGIAPAATAAAPTPSYEAPEDNEELSITSGSMTHAKINYFDLHKLTLKGPRGTADWGAPQDASRKLADDGMLGVGSWWCSEGGWPSPNEKGATEFFYMISGHGCLSDIDGTKHYFGPGDTVIIPKGHQGRWDVFEDIHKVWAVNAHEHVEESRSAPIRTVVEHYSNYFPPTTTTTTDTEEPYSRILYDVGPTKVGVWKSNPASLLVVKRKKSFFHLLEGVMFITDTGGANARRCVAGDTVMLPADWSGSFDILETAKKIWVEVD